MSRPWPEALSRCRGLLPPLLAVATVGCALVTCQPLTIVVAEKDERVGVELVPIGLRTDELGRLEEVEGLRRVRTYWVRSEDGGWYVVSPATFAAAHAGEQARVCR